MTPEAVAAVMARDDFVLAHTTKECTVFSSAGPPTAEVHLVTKAFLVFPELKVHCEIPVDSVKVHDDAPPLPPAEQTTEGPEQTPKGPEGVSDRVSEGM